ncbi:MAG: hypothetical protein OEV74_11850 [Cyclobacteriaceae bacterium]|nr:hypothetical protein [Cyclobacteriaceae bacterium]MDH4296969.1 hypothetical protein [Cyclobacteriaceae bacterium]MDH5250458.1 hypothetical protein [Cyclobacteriaceae bacterium]
MHIGDSFWKGVVVLVLVMAFHIPFAQAQDPLSRKPFEQYWTKPRVVPKIGVGAQDRAFVEAGIQWHSIYKQSLTLLSKGPYCTVDVFIDESNILLGPKLGYEFTAGLLGAAVDMTYFIDHNYDGEGGNRQAVVATPKIGVSILGFANLFYGYAIPLSNERITTISQHRFSLIFNLNRDYFDLQEAPRR